MKLKAEQIIPNIQNPRYIKDEAFQKLVQSLKDFPEMADVRPLVVNKDYLILGGNMRFKAMQQAGWKEIPVTVVDWPEDKQKEFIIKDNVSGGEWDWDVLANEWDAQELEEWGLELPDSIKEPDEVEEDEAPEVSSEPAVSKLGEIYQLGRHRVMCGDSTKDIDELMNGSKADLLHTDPPYGIDYEGGSKKRDKINNDSIPVYEFYVDFLQGARASCKDGASAYIWHASSETHNAIQAFIDAGWQYKQYIIWNKNNATFGRQDYHWKHEPCIYGWGQGSHSWHGDRKQETVWDIDRPSRADEHPTMKPLELCTRAINNSSKWGIS